MPECEIDSGFEVKIKKVKNNTKEYFEYRRRWNENPKNFIIGDFPIHLDIELNSTCNLRCVMCYYSFDKPEPKEMLINLVKKIIDEGAEKELASIKTFHRGEPLLYPKLPEVLKYAKGKGIIEVMFNTNATLLSRDKAKNLIEAGLDKINCSVDGYNEESYNKIRIGGSFETVVDNIKELQKLKKEKKVKNPIVRVHMVENPENHKDIQRFIKFWEPIAEQVSVSDLQDWTGNEEDGTPLQNWACAQLWQRLVILADGEVLPCCRGFKGGNEKLYPLGNVNNQTIESIWKGKKLNKLRELHKSGQSHKMRICRLCGIRKNVVSKIIKN